ncbi:MAG: hypothetical protein K2X93_07520 [Candidatus Obscuribacterales bacterium]|nr:hypothetical protein [Candidatus Obscuribacterales bacterium]
MHADTQNKEKVIETSIKPAYPLISNQPERFGALSEAFLYIEEKRYEEVINKIKGISIFVGILLLIPIIGRVTWRVMNNTVFPGTVVDIVKILLVYAVVAIIGALIAYWKYRDKIMEILLQLEDLAWFGDDLARFYMPYVRGELKDFNERLTKAKQDPDLPTGMDLAKELWPVVSLIIKRDPNLLKWGQVGLKAFKTLSVFFKDKDKSKSEPT